VARSPDQGLPFLEGPDNGGAKTHRAAPAEAEARRVASARAFSPARRAREKRRQKMEMTEEYQSGSGEEALVIAIGNAIQAIGHRT
jgi:hypothetical protein